MKLPRLLLICLGIFLLLLSGCNDKPDPVGIGILSSNDLESTRIDTIYATQHTSTKSILNTKYVDRVMLGINTSEGRTYEAWTCLRFFELPDTLLVGATIDSARIQLKSVYTFGNSNSLLTFSTYSALQNWTGESLSFDSLKHNIGPFYNPVNIGSGKYSDGRLTINISDTAVVRSWFSSNADTNKGLILGPSNTSLIKGFYSFNAVDATVRPMLIIKYQKDGQNKTDTLTSGSSRYVSNVTPSVQFDTSSMVYIQNGIAYHGNIWFDYNQLLQQSSIYKATLEMTLDTSAYPNYLYESLYASRTTTNGDIDFNYLSYESAPDLSKKLYKFDIGYIVTAWKNGATIPKLIITGKNESFSFDLFKFFGTGANTPDSLKPRIIITYFTKR